MRALSIVAVLVAGVGFVAPAEAGGCKLGVTKSWQPSFGGRAWLSEAYVNGPQCKGGVGTIVLRAPNGKVVWVDAMPTDDLFVFDQAKSGNKMGPAAVDWLTQSHSFKTTADFPAWKKGADSPVAGEFPFYPDDSVDQATYEDIRAKKQAVFCYVQGMESINCLALVDGDLDSIGVQTFPG